MARYGMLIACTTLGIGILVGAGGHAWLSKANDVAPGLDAIHRRMVSVEHLVSQQTTLLTRLQTQAEQSRLAQLAVHPMRADCAPSVSVTSGQPVPDTVAEDAVADIVADTVEGVAEDPTLLALRARAAVEAEELIDGALRAGEWTDTDNHTFAEKLSLLPGDVAMKERLRIIVALNAGELRAAFTGRPLF